MSGARHRWFVCGLGVLLLVGALPAAAVAGSSTAETESGTASISGHHPGGEYAPAGTAEVSDEARALEAAREADEPVEVLSQRSETRELFALPGGTLEAREYVTPVWTRVSGEWEPVDLELTERPDGSLGPAASTVQLDFSPGGEEPLVTMDRHGRELSLYWPDGLPEPQLDGARAVYPDVLPDVDLRLEALPDGFHTLLVVRSEEGADNPELAEISLRMKAVGLDVTVTDEGGIDARDGAAGGNVFAAPVLLMWDSSIEGAAADGPSLTGDEKGGGSDPGPTDSANLGRLGAEVTDDGAELLLTPDQDVLAGEDTTYPVYIDPQWHTPRASAWTFASRHWADSPQWQFNGSRDAGLGTCVGWAGCNSNELKRLFYQIDTSRFAGTEILQAEFTVPNVHSAQCSDHPVELWRTQGINTSTTWNTQLSAGFWIERLRTESFNYGGSPDQGCDPPGDAEFSIPGAVQQAADQHWSTMTFGLRAGNESSHLHWKRFGADAHLRVEYNRPPHRITPAQLTTEFGGTCKPADDPAHVRSLGSVYATDVTDPDGDPVRVQFRVRWSGGGVWDSPLTTAKASGSTFSVQLPDVIPENETLRVYARASDTRHWGPWSSVDAYPCHLVYDTTVPEAPGITSNRFPESNPGDPEDPWYEGAGHYGSFTFQAADSDVDRYRWGLNGDPSPDAELTTEDGADRSVPVLPQQPGVHFVTAQALDRAGNTSETRTYQFRAGAGQGARAVWDLDEEEDADRAESSGPEYAATLHGGAEAGTGSGPLGGGLELDGTGHASVAGHIVDTSRPFTISAWARLDEKTSESSVIAEQVGDHFPGFALYYSGHFDQWAFLQHRGDDPDDPTRARVLADAPVETGEWTHLAASYDGSALRIFVNGELAGETAHTGSWSAQTALELGGARRDSEVLAHFTGALEEVQLFDYAMVAEEPLIALLTGGERIREEPGRPAMAIFPMDEPAGSEAVTGAADTLPAVFEGEARPGADGVTGGALQLNGVDASARANAGIVDTSGDFAVSGWARLDKENADSGGVVASQAGVHMPGFALYYSPHFDRWAFNQYSEDSPDGRPIRAIQPEGAVAADGEWTHLMGVHDAEDDTLTLYVNGEPAQTRVLGGGFTAPGVTRIGAASFDGEVDAHFSGELDDVRFYNRVVTEYEAEQLYQQSPLVQARWQFEEADGDADDGEPLNTPDSSPRANDLTLHGGADIANGLVDEGALVLGGEGEHGVTVDVPVSTSASFTVTGWAQAASALGEPASVVSAVGAEESAFVVRFVPEENDPGWGRWQLVLREEDESDTAVTRVDSPLLHDARQWSHLAVVYDGFAKRAELYVNGSLEEIVCSDDAPDGAEDGEGCNSGTPWAHNALTFEATDSLQVGRSRADGDWDEYWPGAIDDLWLFQGTLNTAQVRHLAIGESGLPTEVPNP